DLIKIIQKKIRKEQRNALPNGLICLKGGDTEQEMQEIKRKVVEWKLSEFFHEAFFETKKIIYVPLV
ncbi:MAG: 16S rRNA (guanine(527)-N(7))-methyltransferase RsmG, partial [Bacteroidaceae bacterium]